MLTGTDYKDTGKNHTGTMMGKWGTGRTDYKGTSTGKSRGRGSWVCGGIGTTGTNTWMGTGKGIGTSSCSTGDSCRNNLAISSKDKRRWIGDIRVRHLGLLVYFFEVWIRRVRARSD